MSCFNAVLELVLRSVELPLMSRNGDAQMRAEARPGRTMSAVFECDVNTTSMLHDLSTVLAQRWMHLFPFNLNCAYECF